MQWPVTTHEPPGSSHGETLTDQVESPIAQNPSSTVRLIERIAPFTPEPW